MFTVKTSIFYKKSQMKWNTLWEIAAAVSTIAIFATFRIAELSRELTFLKLKLIFIKT